ncbi:MAG: hypothetical protein WBV64_05880, partial [Mycobacterium sp.]
MTAQSTKSATSGHCCRRPGGADCPAQRYLLHILFPSTGGEWSTIDMMSRLRVAAYVLRHASTWELLVFG